MRDPALVLYLEREIDALAERLSFLNEDSLERLLGMRRMLAYQAAEDMSDFPDMSEGLRRLPNKGD
jgi:hypothetical protein